MQEDAFIGDGSICGRMQANMDSNYQVNRGDSDASEWIPIPTPSSNDAKNTNIPLITPAESKTRTAISYSLLRLKESAKYLRKSYTALQYALPTLTDRSKLAIKLVWMDVTAIKSRETIATQAVRAFRKKYPNNVPEPRLPELKKCKRRVWPRHLTHPLRKAKRRIWPRHLMHPSSEETIQEKKIGNIISISSDMNTGVVAFKE